MEIEKFPTRDSLDALLEICYDSFTVKRIFFRSLIKKVRCEFSAADLSEVQNPNIIWIRAG